AGAFSIRGEIDGLGEVLGKLRSLRDSMQRRVLRTAVTKAARVAAKAAKAKAPKDSGLLKKSIGSKVVTYPATNTVVAIIGPRKGFKQQVTGKVSGQTRTEDPALIGHLLEFGRKAVRVKSKKVLSDGSVVYGREVREVAPKPFLRPALDSSKSEM